MMLDRLLVERLQVFASGKVVYDECFKAGVNVICGDNGSGKSTIADLLCFCLGADISDWNAIVLQCDFVLCQVRVGDGVAVLRRNISTKSQQSMDVVYSTIDSLNQDSEWFVFPYNAIATKKSFSQILFGHLNFPEVKAENNITLHQVLRFLFIDQRSPLDSFIKTEPFDSPLTRETTYDLLCGAYDDATYVLQMRRKELEKDLAAEKAALSSLSNLVHTITVSTKEELNASIEEKKRRIDEVNEKLSSRAGHQESDVNEQQQYLDTLKVKISSHAKDYQLLFEGQLKLSDKISDSESFIAALEAKKLDLDESIEIRKQMGDIQLEYCPICLSTLEHPKDGECCLCKRPESASAVFDNAMRMKDELQFQLVESKCLQKKRKAQFGETENRLIQIGNELQSLRAEYSTVAEQVGTASDIKRESLIFEKARLVSNIEANREKLRLVEKIEKLAKSKSDIQGRLDRTNSEIQRKRIALADRKSVVKKLVDRLAKGILSKDIRSTKELHHADEIEVLIDKNTYALDGRNNFSASANVILKNSLRFALFFASLEDEAMRYPRFIFCDNTEDKGMEEVRAHNFQDTIIQLSNQTECEHQIIYTTSKPTANLTDEMKVGQEWYTEEFPTLRFF
ncbi:AAA family ATPase [Halodesulfovibrio aestuarii]|uniref:AAA family ATPase n=1 Tax=Halodesulfovibrio aestuarii TaxID=126333 RepID=UPI00042192F8